MTSSVQQCPGLGTMSPWSAQCWDTMQEAKFRRIIQLLVGGLISSLFFWVYLPRTGTWSERGIKPQEDGLVWVVAVAGYFSEQGCLH